MSAPPPPPFDGPAPTSSALPEGWTEHISPQGHPYYYNASTGQSTYTRPASSSNGSAVPPPPPPLPAGFNQQTAPIASSSTVPTAASVPKKKKKKEKPVAKVVIEGTPWLQITTNEGNVFYTNTETKSSVWTVPEEIKEQVEALSSTDGAQQNGAESEAARLLKEKEEEMARLREELEAEREASRKRKIREEQEEEEEQQRLEEQAKRLRMMQQAREEEAEQESAQEGAGSPSDEQEQGDNGVAEEEQQGEPEPELEDWQKDELRLKAEMEAELAEEEAAAQEAALAEEKKKKKVEESAPAATAEEQLSSEEGIALFKTMLAEKEINPMKPWDMELPKFINDTRYKAVKSLRERKDLFDEHCRLKIRENRAKKAASGQAKADPASAYRALLVAEVTSTRTHWEDFKKKHKKDSRFREFGRDDREREKAFRQWLRDLGEIKRADAQKAEQKFLQMLSEQSDLTESSSWSNIKARLSSDPRYSLIASSSQREEIFKKHLATLSSSSQANGTHGLSPEEAKRKAAEDRKARQAAALREREEKVRRDKEAMDRAAGRSRAEAGREESERLWKGLLIDAVRDHEASWSATLPTLEADPRYRSSTLSLSEKRRLFDDHLSELYTKRVTALEALFASHASSLTTPFSDVYASISENPTVTRLRLSESKIERLYDAWSRKRIAQARSDFDAMLSESNFVEYWGSLKNEAESAARGDGEERAKGVLAAGDEDEQEEGLATTTDETDLKTLAAQVDLRELEAVLSHDKRYTIFDAEPEQRQQWIKEYLVKLGRPKKTVHQH